MMTVAVPYTLKKITTKTTRKLRNTNLTKTGGNSGAQEDYGVDYSL
jgi:hypothetical protein